MTLGFVKLPRRIFFDRIWSKSRIFSAFEAYIYILQRANYAAGSFKLGSRTIYLEAGQLFCSVRSLADAWGWQRGTVERFLDHLESRQFISLVTHNHGTYITILSEPPERDSTGEIETADGSPKGIEIQWFTEHKSAGARDILKKNSKEEEEKKKNRIDLVEEKKESEEPEMTNEETVAYVRNLIAEKFPQMKLSA